MLAHEIAQRRDCSHLFISSAQSRLTLLAIFELGLMQYQMLKHGRAGVPMEVMGLMLGEFVDGYTVCPFEAYTR